MVSHTAARTFIGRAAHLVATATLSMDAGHFQKIIGVIGNFLVAVI